jgi:hypothetical protein
LASVYAIFFDLFAERDVVFAEAGFKTTYAPHNARFLGGYGHIIIISVIPLSGGKSNDGD